MKRLDNECLTRMRNHHRCIDWLDTSLKPRLGYCQHCTFPVSKHRQVSSRSDYEPFHHFLNPKWKYSTSMWNCRFSCSIRCPQPWKSHVPLQGPPFGAYQSIALEVGILGLWILQRNPGNFELNEFWLSSPTYSQRSTYMAIPRASQLS